jgi:hypothetical protein
MSLNVNLPMTYRLPLILVAAETYLQYILWCHDHYINPNNRNLVRYIVGPENLRAYSGEHTRLIILGSPHWCWSNMGRAMLYSYKTKVEFAKLETCPLMRDMIYDHTSLSRKG